MAHPLKLRPPGPADEAQVRAANTQMIADDKFTFALSYVDGMPWSEYLTNLNDYRRGLNLPDGLVPASFLVAEVAGDIVGRLSLRHELNDHLLREGGHLGYGVVAPYRGRGYASEILRQGLILARGVGVTDALLFCDSSNVGSAKVIERCNGEFDGLVINSDGDELRRYWIRY